MRKNLKVCGIGNAITDVLIEVSDEELSELEEKKGSTVMVEPERQALILEKFRNKEMKLASGGSTTNSLIAIQELGGASAFVGCVGDDRFGNRYVRDCEESGLTTDIQIRDGVSGTCLSLITPDAERTMFTSLGVAGEIKANEINSTLVEQSEWVLLEGYLLDAAESELFMDKALSAAKSSDTRIAFACSAAFVIEVFKERLKPILEASDLIFMNEVEASALSGQEDPERACKDLLEKYSNVIVTAGKAGSYAGYEGEFIHTPSVECKPVDLTGAGDMFAGALLYGLSAGIGLKESANSASYLCSKLIEKTGARLSGDLKTLWKKGASLPG